MNISAFSIRIPVKEVPLRQGLRREGRAKLETSLFCVYSHSVNGEIFYIGHGTLTHPFCLSGPSGNMRGGTWSSIVSKHGYFDLAILEIFPTKKEAAARERELTRLHKPAANHPASIHTECSNCGVKAAKLIKGRCERCYAWQWRKGEERPL